MEELHQRVSQVVREVLQDEMHELKDLLASLLQQQAGFSEEINKTLSMSRAPTPKTSKGQRLAPAPSPRSFTDHHGGSGQLTLGQLQERHAEWLRSVSDGMAFMPARSIPLPSLDEKTSSKSILPLAIPIPASHSNRAAAHSYGEPELATMKNSSPTLGVLLSSLRSLLSMCAPGERPVNTGIGQPHSARDEHCVMAEAEDKQNDTQEEASLGRYGQCMSTTAKALLKLFGVLPCQGCVGYLSPAIVYLLLLLAAVGPLLAFSDPHRHVALMGNYLSQAAGQNCENYDSWSLQLSHVVAAAVFSMLMFLKLHVLSCLDLMIDDFSRQYAEHGNAEHGIWQWSLIQATLNQASNRLEGSFLVSFTAITAGFA
ncbi:unnamed protein product [Polarella glacialis]|uniref:Uncharacterized protein n=1 Tax=Polarella glacialis TaxID=89957 RepID=A0A813FHC1_POLGL|nr:unnamed protein product [Polarella glacialis]